MEDLALDEDGTEDPEGEEPTATPSASAEETGVGREPEIPSSESDAEFFSDD